jgi:hypothetical protein
LILHEFASVGFVKGLSPVRVAVLQEKAPFGGWFNFNKGAVARPGYNFIQGKVHFGGWLNFL